MEYFIALDNQRRGPFSLEQLAAEPLNADTLVWCQGMAGWAKADTVPEVRTLLEHLPPPIPDLPSTDEPPSRSADVANAAGTAEPPPAPLDGATAAADTFRFRSGAVAARVRDWVNLCDAHWDDAKWHLSQGHLEPWLRSIGRSDVAEAATKARTTVTDPEAGLRWFLKKFGEPGKRVVRRRETGECTQTAPRRTEPERPSPTGSLPNPDQPVPPIPARRTAGAARPSTGTGSDIPAGVKLMLVVLGIVGLISVGILPVSCGKHLPGARSYYQQFCDDCNGTGMVQWRCQTCGGRGYFGGARCPDCGGAGSIKQACPYCGGSGKKPKKE